MDVLQLALDCARDDADQEELSVDGSHLDRERFAVLYERHLPGIYSYIRSRTGSDEDATDLAHQVFVRALEALPRYRDRGVPPGAWLYRIARNAVIDARRRARGSISWDMVPEMLQPQDAADVEASVVWQEQAERLHRLLQTLDEEKREVLVLRFASGLKVREIAAILDRSEAAVKTEIRRTLRKLREQYHDN